MTQTIDDDIRALRATMAGPVLAPADADYDRARSIWNGEFDRRPAVVARCSGAADVAAALAFARSRGLEVTVRGGGHSSAGAAARDGALMIDLSPLRQVTVDPQARLARAGGGATLGDLDAATQEHGLAVAAGMISETGIGGLTLGGGMGWLTPQQGLTVDNLVGAEVVTADGQILRVSESEHPDLLWALRGGGGNFGVVTEFVYRLREVGPMVQLGLLFFDLAATAEVLALRRELDRSLPPDVTVLVSGINAPPAPFVPPELHFRPGLAVIVAGFGADAEHAALLERVRGTVTPLFEFAAPMPYVALQQLVDEAAPWGSCCYERGLYLDDLTDEAIAVIAEHLPAKVSGMSMLHFYQLAGAYNAVADDATAFGGSRDARYGVFVIGVTADPAALPAERDWVRALSDALRPHALAGGYVNAYAEYGDERVHAIYGPKYDRLARVKATYDPTNVFRSNANIVPA